MEPTHEHEEWRPVAGASGYEVSNLGRVRSLDRYRTRRLASGHLSKPWFVRGRMLKPQEMKLGYLAVWIYTDGGRLRKVHALVTEAFHGPRPTPESVIRHMDGNPGNNTVENLRWGTPSENSLDRVRHGRHFAALRTHCPQGHPYAGDNLVVERGRRVCRECRNRRARVRGRLKSGTYPAPPKTHCKNGHEFTPENTRIYKKSGARGCRICKREWTRADYWRRKSEEAK